MSKHNPKHVDKDIKKKLMSVACHPTRWWYWWLPEDENKDNRTNFYR